MFYLHSGRWSANDAENHPEWCARNKDGSFIINGMSSILQKFERRRATSFLLEIFMCKYFYHNSIISQVKEICDLYEVDGFWFDIYQTYRLCYCKNCIELMESKNIDSHDKPLVEEFYAHGLKTL